MEMAMALANIADAKLAAGDVAEARHTAERGLRLLQASSSSFALDDLLEKLATCRTTTRDYRQAAELFGAASASRERMRVPIWALPWTATSSCERFSARNLSRKATEHDRCVVPTETGRVRDGDANVGGASLVRDVVEIALGVGRLVVDRRR